MNLKKSLTGAIAGLALVGSIAAPIASAQYAGDDTSNNTTTVSLTVANDGVFDVYFYLGDISLGTATFNSASSTQTLNGAMGLGYTDTKAARPSFDVLIQSTDFLNEANNATTPIPSSGFKITKTYNVLQGQWGSDPDIGDIGAFKDELYVAQSGGPWSWTTNNTLNGNRRVNFGYAGIGTNWSIGYFDVSLDVPNTTASGDYQSTMTLTVIAGSQP